MILKEIPTAFAQIVRPIIDRDYRHELVRRHILHPAQQDLADGVIGASTFTRLETSLENRKAGKYIDLYASQMLFQVPEKIALFSGAVTEAATGDPTLLGLAAGLPLLYRLAVTFFYSRKNPELTCRLSYLSVIPIVEYFAVPLEMSKECEAARYMLAHLFRIKLPDEHTLNSWANHLTVTNSTQFFR